MADVEALLVLYRMRIQNANAISSPLTWGFPSPSAFTGFIHALQRRVGEDLQLSFDGVAIVCHDFECQASQPSGKHHRTFHLPRYPITKEGKTAPIVEEGRAHLCVSLVIGVTGAGLYAGAELAALADSVGNVLGRMRLAGGSVLQDRSNACEMHLLPGTVEERQRLSRAISRRLLPGFVVVSRECILQQHWASMKESKASSTLLDALLDLSSLNIEPAATVASGKASESGKDAETMHAVEWRARRRRGWLVPLPAGYAALTRLYPPGEVKNARDRTVPFRFVEGIYTIGEWMNPMRLDDICQAFWFHMVDENTGVYRWTTPHFALQNDIEGK